MTPDLRARRAGAPSGTEQEDRRLRILHVITGLGTGGAEMMLVKLLGAVDRDAFDMRVVSLLDGGTLAPRLAALGVEVQALEMRRGRASVSGFRRLRAMVHAIEPDLVQGWMYHGNLAASAASVAQGRRIPVAWNIRQTVYRLADNGAATAAVIRLGALASGTARAIVYNSALSRAQHERLGYASRHAVLVPNGFDCSEFRPDAAAPEALRRRLGVAPTRRLVGMVARYHEMKDFPTMFRAASLVCAVEPDVDFVLAGRGVTRDNAALAPLLAELPSDRVHLLGEVRDTPALMAGLDVVCSSSAWGEGFPNVLGEAMASGVPCVATDVGDSATILGEAGIVVPPGDAHALANGVTRLLRLPKEERRRLSLEARERIASRYSLGRIASEYEDLYRRMILPARWAPPDRLAGGAADKAF